MKKVLGLVLGSLLLVSISWAGSTNFDATCVSVSTAPLHAAQVGQKVLDARAHRTSLSLRNLSAATTQYYSNTQFGTGGWPVNYAPDAVMVLPAATELKWEGEFTYSGEIYMISQPSATAASYVNILETW